MEHSLQESEIGQIKKYEICKKFTRLRCFPGIFFQSRTSKAHIKILENIFLMRRIESAES